MTTQSAPAFIGFFFAVIFAVGALSLHGPVPVDQMERHEVKINPNPIPAEDIPETATVVNYRTLSENETAIANDIIGGEDSNLGYTNLHEYEYRATADLKPAATFTSADYLQYDNAYYPIFASVSEYESSDPKAVINNGLALFCGLFAVFFFLGGIGAAIDPEV